MASSIHIFKPGDKVRLSARFLQATGQHTGPEPRKRWTILAIDCHPSEGPEDGLAVVDEKRELESWTAPDGTRMLDCWTEAEVTANPSIRQRRINVRNLTKVGTFSSRDAT